MGIGIRENEPSKIRKALATSGPFHPGKLSQQYTVCNQPNCACKRKDNPKKHGPYYQLSYAVKGRSRTRFVKQHDIGTVQQYINEYQRVKALLQDLSEAYVSLFKEKGWDLAHDNVDPNL